MGHPVIDELLDDAERLIQSREDSWPRGSALLGRMALEEWVRTHAMALDPGLALASMRSQLLCISVRVGAEQAARANFLWSALSSACHHHAYELSPTRKEIGALIRDAREMVGPPHPNDASSSPDDHRD